MPLRNRATTLLYEVLVGDSDADSPHGDSRRGLHAAEDGKLMFVTAVAVLGFSVLIGLVANTGQAVTQKMELQNAADSAAYSSALWMARGMNAITTTNHLMGEATALVVILDSFGGPLLRSGKDDETDENTKLNDKISKYSDEPNPPWPHKQASTNGVLEPIDSPIIGFLTDQMTDDGNDKIKSGATLYDAQLTLKTYMVSLLILKSTCGRVVDFTFWIPVIGPIIEYVCLGVQLGASALIWKIGQEWLTLQALQSILGTVWTDTVRDGIAKSPGVITALSLYGDTVAGQLDGKSKPARTAMNEAVEGSLKTLGQRHVAQLSVYPAPKDLRLPLVREEAPFTSEQSGDKAEIRGKQVNLGPWEKPQIKWSGNDTDPALQALFDLIDTIQDAKEIMDDWVGKLKLLVDNPLFDLLPSIEIGGVDLNPTKAIEGLTDGLTKFDGLKDLPDKPNNEGFKENPSLDDLKEFHVDAEAVSQWGRATYPVVDSIRGPIREFFQDVCGWSNASTYFVHWSNRYTVDVTHEIRTQSDAPHMYLLNGMVPQEKGNEEFTTNEVVAERMFTVVGVAHRTHRNAIAAPGAKFTNVDRDGTYAVSEAMFYNANGRKVAAGRGRTQPNTGWDTLNWEPAVKAWEWGDHQPSGGGGDPWDFFTGSLNAQPSARVKLNWQSKLVPIGEPRFKELLKKSNDNDAKRLNESLKRKVHYQH